MASSDERGQRHADRLLLERYAPATVVVDPDLQIVQFHGDTGPYVSAPAGRTTASLLKMLRSGLLAPVREAIQRVQRQGRPVREDGIAIREGGRLRRVNIIVAPLDAVEAPGRLAVMFEEPRRQRARARQREADREAGTGKSRGRETLAQRLESLERELASTRQYLHALDEQHESDMADAKVELDMRNEGLALDNADLVGLLDSLGLPIVILDWDLAIRRYTVAAEKLLRLIPSDIGRPVTDIRFDIEVPDIEALFAKVLEGAEGVERNIRDRQGCWWSLRVRPCRNSRDKVAGVVLVFVDIPAPKGG